MSKGDDGLATDRDRHLEEHPPECTLLQGDSDIYPVICPECGRHVRTPYSHRKDCEHWGGVANPRVEDGDQR